MFSAVFPSFSIIVGFLACLVLVGRLSPSDSPLLLVILVFEDFIVSKIQFYTQNTQISILKIYFVVKCH